MKPFVSLIPRPSKKPTISLPFGARSVGHRLADPTYHSKTKPGEDMLELMWTIDGEGELCVDGETRTISAGQVAFVVPGPVRYFRQKPGGKPWHYRWLTLDGEEYLSTFKLFGVTTWPRRVGPCPEADFVQLESEIGDITPNGERRACATAFRILCQATGSISSAEIPNMHVERAKDLIDSCLGDPALSVDMLAAELELDRSTFSRLFRKNQQMPPSTYIMKRRLSKAMQLLRSTGLSVALIAKRCGVADPYYFSRMFRKHIGQSPRQFRDEIGVSK